MSDRLSRAIVFAANYHAGQKDKGGEPYILHSLRVMMKMETEEEKVVAVLHDVLEDTEATEEEILETMDDLRAIGVDILTLGQYLRPTQNHLPVEQYVTPEDFNRYREIGLEKGFMEVPSGPMVRSSYRADRVFEKNNLGLAVPDVPASSNAQQIPVKAVD